MSGGMGRQEGGTSPLQSCAEVLALKGPLVAGADLSLTCGQHPVGSIAEHAHDQLEIDFLFEPAAAIFDWLVGSDRREESVFGPAVVIVPPHLRHACVWERAAEVLAMYVEPHQFTPMFGDLSTTAFTTLPIAAQDLALWQVAHALRGVYYDHNQAEGPTLQYLGLALCHHASDLFRRIVPRPINRVAEEVVRKIADFVTNRLAANIHADDLARAVNYSVAHLTALFKEAIGLTPTEYLFRRRMERANELLRTGLMTIGEVAAKVSYMDQANFAKKFRAYWGYSPKQAIQQARLESANRPKIS